MKNKYNWIKSVLVVIWLFTLFFGMTTDTRAEKKEEGMYFGLLGVENHIGGDFDGNVTGVFLDNSTVLIRIPEIESGRGFGILVGGYNKKLAGELYYSCSNHDTIFKYSDYNCNGTEDLGEDTVVSRDGECQVFGANIKYYFANLFDGNVRFFGQFGLFIPKITMEQGAYQRDVYIDTADVTFTGYGADLGLGILLHIHPNLAITGSSVFRHIRIKEATAFGQDRVPTDSMYGTGRSYSIGLNYYF